MDAGDHPPITPMKTATESELGHDAWKVYDYITRHFIATVSCSCAAALPAVTDQLLCWRYSPHSQWLPTLFDGCNESQSKRYEREKSTRKQHF